MKKELFDFSPPAQVAGALGLSGKAFTYPQPDKPIYVDMEAFVRALPSLSRINRMIADNAEHWEKWWRDYIDPDHIDETRPMFHDNISVAQIVIADVYDFPWVNMRGWAAWLVGNRVRSAKQLIDVVGFMFGILGLNMSYTLNPQGRPELKNVQAMDLVKARKPRTLLVNLGANDGLFNTGFEGNPTLSPERRDQILARYKKLAEHLAELDEETEQIVINRLVLPSQVPNQMPADKVVNEGIPPGPNGYYEWYENRMGFEYGRIEGEVQGTFKDMVGQDGFITEINDGMAEIMEAALGKRVSIVDTDGALRKLNNKHLLGSQGEDTIKVYPRGDRFPLSIGNKMIEMSPIGPGRFGHGGFCGLDGMHPSVVGYGMIANEVLKSMKQQPSIDYTACYKNDTLLTDVPLIWPLLWSLYRDYRRGKGRGGPTTMSAEEVGFAELVAGCSRAFNDPELSRSMTPPKN